MVKKKQCVQLIGFYCNLCRFLLNLLFTLFCREIYFATIYALSCGEKLSPKVHMWRKNDKYQVCSWFHPYLLIWCFCCITLRRNGMWIWVSMAKVGWEWGRVPRLGAFCQAPITLDFLPTPCSRPTPTLNHLETQIRGRLENWRKAANEITSRAKGCSAIPIMQFLLHCSQARGGGPC